MRPRQWRAQSPEEGSFPLGVCCVSTHAACNAWLHGAGESFLASLSFSSPPQQGRKIPRKKRKKKKWVGKKNKKAALFRATPGLPATSPRKKTHTSPLTWTAANRWGLRCLCAHLRRVSSNARCLRQPHSHIHSGSVPSRGGNSRASVRPCLTSAHLLWQPSARRGRRLVDTGGTSATWR